MSDFMEAVLTLLPRDAGGRLHPVSPRDGSYRPFTRFEDGGPLLRVRLIEGPPTLAPGDSAPVVLELESDIAADFLRTGAEAEVLETAAGESRVVGLVAVARLWREAVTAL